MRVIRLPGRVPGSTALLLLLSLFVVGCGSGSTSTSTSAASSSASTATPCPSPRARSQFRATIGTISSISANTLQIASVSGGSATVTYSSSTRFLRETTMKLSALREGTPVTVTVTQNADNSYSATRITVVNRASLQASRPRINGNSNCLRSQFNNGGAGFGGVGTANTRGISGTTGQVNGDTLTVTDAQGSDYTVNVTSATQILQTVSATAADLKTGTAVSVSGAPASSGAIDARTVTILPKLPTGSTQ
jgi:hypothetical protein